MSDYFDRSERRIVARVEAGAPSRSRFRLRLDLVVPALSVVVAVAIGVVFLSAHRSSSPGSSARGAIELVYQVEPTPQTPVVTRAVVARAIDVMRARAQALGVSGASFVPTGNQITVRLPGVTNATRTQREFGTTAGLEFYDWEANVLTPNGKPAADLLQVQDPRALVLSQGAGGSSGVSGAGSMSLYDAVRLAARQPRQVSHDNSRAGSEYYLFGAPGSAACATAARDAGTAPERGVHCLLSGPYSAVPDLNTGLPQGVRASQGQLLVIKQGTVVLRGPPPSVSSAVALGAPTARYYVLKDHVALFGNDITNPQESTDQAGHPDVAFGFTSNGGDAFQSITAAIAKRGSILSPPGQQLNQHFGIALDNQLINVSPIDFRHYPDGIPAANGAQLHGLTNASARDLATELRLGALPTRLRLIVLKRLSNHG